MDNRGKRIAFNIIGSILTVVLIALFFMSIINIVFNFVYIKTNVYGYSMCNTLNQKAETISQKGDTVFINKYAPVTRGDIVVANVSWNNKPIIKRLVAMPNDSLFITEENDNYVLMVNNSPVYTRPIVDEYLHENDGGTIEYYATKYSIYISNNENVYLDEEKTMPRIITNENGKKMIKLYDNEYFFIGDNWASSDDSMVFGPSPLSSIVGRVDIVIPINANPVGHMLKAMLKATFCV